MRVALVGVKWNKVNKSRTCVFCRPGSRAERQVAMGNQIDKVLPGLYVGGILGQDRKQKLQENKITHVLSIHDHAEPEYTDLFTYKCIQVSDISSSDLSKYFSECVDFIHQCRLNGGSVFVHCAAGISRSVTMTVMYMMTVSEYNFEECLTAVRACREVANPNYGFRMQLKQYEGGKMTDERKRVLADYPATPSLGDNAAISLLIKSAKEKGRGASDDPYSSMKPSSFTGARRTEDTSSEKKDDPKTEKAADAKKGSKKGFFGVF